VVILHLTIFLAVICEGETSLNPLSLFLSNPRLPGTSPLGLAFLNRKDLPIVVTLGGVGPCYTSLAFHFIAFAPGYKLFDNKIEDISEVDTGLDSQRDEDGEQRWTDASDEVSY